MPLAMRCNRQAKGRFHAVSSRENRATSGMADAPSWVEGTSAGTVSSGQWPSSCSDETRYQ